MTLFVSVNRTLTQPFLLITITLILQGIIWYKLIILAIEKDPSNYKKIASSNNFK